MKYVDGKPVGCTKVVVSTQHNEKSRNGKTYTPSMVSRSDRRRGRVGVAEGLDAEEVRLPGQSDRQLRGRRTRRRLRPDRPQDHRRHLRRLCAARRRRVLRQGPDQGRSLGGLCHALPRQERGGRRPCRTLHHPGRLRDRRCRPDVGAGRHPRHRQGRRKEAREGAAGDFPADADQHPPLAQAEPADLPPHRGLRPLRPRAREGRRILLGADQPGEPAQERAVK